jgi:hypothetical protein
MFIKVTAGTCCTDVVIKAVENMAYNQGLKSLKFKNRNGFIYHDAEWIAGVDYDDIETKEENDEQYSDDTQDNENEDQLEQYEHIDPEEIDDIVQYQRQNINPNVHEENDNAIEQQLDHPEEPHKIAEDEEPGATTEPTTRKST